MKSKSLGHRALWFLSFFHAFFSPWFEQHDLLMSTQAWHFSIAELKESHDGFSNTSSMLKRLVVDDTLAKHLIQYHVWDAVSFLVINTEKISKVSVYIHSKLNLTNNQCISHSHQWFLLFIGATFTRMSNLYAIKTKYLVVVVHYLVVHWVKMKIVFNINVKVLSWKF